MADERVMTEDEIETAAWRLEAKMMEIRRDPRAALTAELAKIRAQQIAELRAWWAKKQAEIEEQWTKRCAKREEEWAKWCAKRDADIAKLTAEWADEMSSASAELRAAFADFIRLRQREPAPPTLQ
jgi:hypothetical protein